MELFEIVDKLECDRKLSKKEFVRLINGRTNKLDEYLFEKSRKIRHEIYDNKIYIRGLIEFTNYCKNDCYYCGIRCGNKNAERYRLSGEDILLCCKEGYKLGFRTFVMQGGEDTFFSTEKMCEIVSEIKENYPDCAVTLSIGEKSYEEYKMLFDAGADRFLLRHETANETHYGKLHPKNLSHENRLNCLYNLKEIGYQVGSGFMVGSPFQTAENLAEDLLFLEKLSPQMVGIGPFIPHKDSIFAGNSAGSVELTLFLIGILRLMLPNALIPATTSLGTASFGGRERGILAGANVVMPNLSPISVRKKYMLYNDKICTDEESAEMVESLRKSMFKIGYEVVTDRGDYKLL